MKVKALQRFRNKLAKDEPVSGLWITLEAPSLTEMAVALDLDYVVIDTEHGHLGWKEIAEHVRATVRSETVSIVRIQERDTAVTKRILDIGADGIVVPGIETVEQIEAALSDCLYPPEGRRGIGGERAMVWGQAVVEHTNEANEHALVIPLIESVTGAQNIAQLCQVEGIDVFYFGPADFSASAGFRGQWEGPGVAEQILEAKDVIRSAGKSCGLIAKSEEDLCLRREQGFRMLGLGSDASIVLNSLHQRLRALGIDRHPSASLDPNDAQPVPKGS